MALMGVNMPRDVLFYIAKSEFSKWSMLRFRVILVSTVPVSYVCWTDGNCAIY